MAFRSILFPEGGNDAAGGNMVEPGCFADLGLDKIVAAITAGKEAYNLKPFFHVPLNDIQTIAYRYDIMRDLEAAPLMDEVRAFAHGMNAVRERIVQSEKRHCKYQKQWLFVDAVETYCSAIQAFAQALERSGIASAGLAAWREYLSGYAGSKAFVSMLHDTLQLKADMHAVQYCLHIKGNTIVVGKYASEPDYSASVERTFEKFKRAAVKDYRVKFSDWPDMNHVEAAVLDLVAQLNPEVFLRLESYCAVNADYLDRTVASFDREVQFYVSYLEYTAAFRQSGLSFCYAKVGRETKAVNACGCFDLALARKLLDEKAAVVCNDFHLDCPERIFVVSGPNNGGKTTFARTFGQLHYLASLGCPVAGKQAQLFHFDRLLTHFEREENIKNLRGKLQDDLVRIHEILERATPDSIVIMNEIFTSTTTQDALVLSRRVLDEIMERDLLCVCVTFLDELSQISEKTVSVASTIVPGNPTMRTFRIVRKRADGLAYAISVAEKYRLTYSLLKERLQS